jgi:hypothetical protein
LWPVAPTLYDRIFAALVKSGQYFRQAALEGEFFSPELMVAGDISPDQIDTLFRKVEQNPYTAAMHANTEKYVIVMTILAPSDQDGQMSSIIDCLLYFINQAKKQIFAIVQYKIFFNTEQGFFAREF